MNKLNSAKAALTGDITCAVYRDQLFTSVEKGIRPLLLWLDTNDTFLCGAAVADKVIGRAAAFILIRGKACHVYGEVMSEGAKELLLAAGITAKYGKLCKCINNREGTGICPMEALIKDDDDTNSAYAKLREKVLCK